MINVIQTLIAKAVEGIHLTREESERAFQILLAGGATPAQVSAFLVALRMKGETPEEILGAAYVLRAKMDRVEAPEDAIDVCGTGGDSHARAEGATLNISTAVALVVAGCGVPVVKHGNKAVSSQSGSADVLAQLGVNVQMEKPMAEACLTEANFCFLFAPLYHKSLRHITPVRKELGLRTIFNLLGPLANPANPKRQLMGVYDAALLQPVAEVLRGLGSVRAMIVHGSDGMDELTLTGPSSIAELDDGEIRMRELTPEDAGLQICEPGTLKGSSPQGNAFALRMLLKGQASVYRDIVCYNAGAALWVAGKVQDVREGVIMAAESIDTGHAIDVLATLVRLTNAL